MVSESFHESEAVFRAIADPTRRQILGLLRTGESTVGTLASNFRTSRPAISRHLRLLRSAGLVTTQKRGTARICRLNPMPLQAVDDWLRDYQAFWQENLQNLKQFVEENPMSQTTQTIVQEIVINAPASRVFDALVNPQKRMKWWGQGQMQTTHMESDLRPGGAWLMNVNGYGKPQTIHGEYRAVEEPRLLEFTWLPSWQENAEVSLVRFELTEKDGHTTVRLTHSGLTERGLESHRGWPLILGWLKGFAEAGA
jgi:uncharacterized protein YndB with AHSA1/START domain/DNA-binding transcriptional ArsR family regulator